MSADESAAAREAISGDEKVLGTAACRVDSPINNFQVLSRRKVAYKPGRLYVFFLSSCNQRLAVCLLKILRRNFLPKDKRDEVINF